MQHQKIIQLIVDWLKSYSENSKTNGFVVGVSGGIDSALTSTLCALTGKPVLVLNMPILQQSAQHKRAKEHIEWLKQNFSNVTGEEIDLTDTFKAMSKDLPASIQDDLTMANLRSRLRMITLYAFAGNKKLLVAGTGNKIEDFGIGFFTKYGDGGVDLSPIADLTKSEVFALAKHLNIVESIQTARPTDGLWDDDRSDEDQIGATYPELEWAMNYVNTNSTEPLSARQKEVLNIYTHLNTINQHKMNPIPVCSIDLKLKK
jgi:NAD+ synthase